MTLQITPEKKLIEHTILGEFRRFQESLTISLPVGVVGKSVVAGHQQVDRVDLRRLIKNNCHLNKGFFGRNIELLPPPCSCWQPCWARSGSCGPTPTDHWGEKIIKHSLFFFCFNPNRNIFLNKVTRHELFLFSYFFLS